MVSIPSAPWGTFWNSNSSRFDMLDDLLAWVVLGLRWERIGRPCWGLIKQALIAIAAFGANDHFRYNRAKYL